MFRRGINKRSPFSPPSNWKVLCALARKGDMANLGPLLLGFAPLNISTAQLSRPDLITRRQAIRRLATIAAEEGHRHIVEFLCLKYCVYVNHIIPSERRMWEEGDDEFRIEDSETTPLMGAIMAQNEEMALFLLRLHERQEQQERDAHPNSVVKKIGLDVDRLMDENRTILQCAVFCELPRVAKALLVEYGANLFAKDVRGHCALCTATFKCHVEMLNVFLTHCRKQGCLRKAVEEPCGVLTDTRCPMSLLFHFPSDERISRQEEVTVARMLVQDYGADVKATHCGEHAVHFAGTLCTRPLAEFYLSEYHLPVNIVTPFMKKTVLHTTAASHRGRVDPVALVRMVKWLVEEKGASITLKDGSGRTAADLAMQAGNRNVYVYLHEKLKQHREADVHLRQADLAQRERQAAQAAEAFMAELDAEAKEEEKKKKAKKLRKEMSKKKKQHGVE